MRVCKSPQMSPTYPPKNPYLSAKEPYTSTKEPFTSAKEPYTCTKEPYISAKEPYMSAKELYTSAKEAFISAKEPDKSAQELYFPQKSYTHPHNSPTSPEPVTRRSDKKYMKELASISCQKLHIPLHIQIFSEHNLTSWTRDSDLKKQHKSWGKKTEQNKSRFPAKRAFRKEPCIISKVYLFKRALCLPTSSQTSHVPARRERKSLSHATKSPAWSQKSSIFSQKSLLSKEQSNHSCPPPTFE